VSTFAAVRADSAPKLWSVWRNPAVVSAPPAAAVGVLLGCAAADAEALGLAVAALVHPVRRSAAAPIATNASDCLMGMQSTISA
jgi:hypothetical protein